MTNKVFLADNSFTVLLKTALTSLLNFENIILSYSKNKHKKTDNFNLKYNNSPKGASERKHIYFVFRIHHGGKNT